MNIEKALVVVLLVLPLTAQRELPLLVRDSRSAVVTVVIVDDQGKPKHSGTGFFVGSEGYVVTNQHVLEAVVNAVVRTVDGKSYPVDAIVARDRFADLVLVRVKAAGAPVRSLPLAGSPPEVGERILVIGSPLGLEQTVTDGIVSSLRDLPGYGAVLQISAPISPGSSGSPVVNLRGEVVGVATFHYERGQNLNFAMPASRIVHLLAAVSHTPSEASAVAKPDSNTETDQYRNIRDLVLSEQYSKALPYLEELTRRRPEDPEAWYSLGHCKSKLGMLESALEAYKTVVALRPDDPEAHYNLGVAYGRLHRMTEEREAYLFAIELKNDYVEAYNNLGWTYHSAGEVSLAIEAWQKAVKLRPGYARAHFNLGVAYMDLGRTAEAIDEFHQALALRPDYAQASLALGQYYESVKRTTDAISAYKRVTELDPSNVRASFRLGLLYISVGDRIAALRQYQVLRSHDRALADELFQKVYKRSP